MSATATTLPGSPADELKALIEEGAAPGDVARYLDTLGHEARVAAVRGTGRAQQRALWQLADGFAPVRLDELVPADTPEMQAVRHYGRNTLPLFTHFEKRFCRPAGLDANSPSELHGFNFQTLAAVTGPGYFVAVASSDRDEVVIDYRRVPDVQPEGWPAIRSNERGLSRLVYGFMVDTLRRVSEHVTIGSAAKNGKELGSRFLLCREA